MTTTSVRSPSAGPRRPSRPATWVVVLLAGLLGVLLGALLLAPAAPRLVPADAEQAEVDAFLSEWDAALRSRDMAEIRSLATPEATFHGRAIGSTAAESLVSLGWAPGQEVSAGEALLTRGDPVVVHVARVVERQGIENLEWLRLQRTPDGLRVASVEASTMPV
jgi:hypothetical protein